MPLLKRLPECTRSTVDILNIRLHQEVQDFTDWISPTTKEAELRAYVVRQVVQCVETAFPSCRAYPFGSFSTKLYHPDAYVASSSMLKIVISIWWLTGLAIPGTRTPCES
jgi:DNA polymerase sigma